MKVIDVIDPAWRCSLCFAHKTLWMKNYFWALDSPNLIDDLFRLHFTFLSRRFLLVYAISHALLFQFKKKNVGCVDCWASNINVRNRTACYQFVVCVNTNWRYLHGGFFFFACLKSAKYLIDGKIIKECAKKCKISELRARTCSLSI